MSFLNRSLGPLFFPSILWRSESTSIHFTFDDGPHPSETAKILEVLQKHGVRATFFLLGEKVRKHPQLARDIAAAGHVIGSHSMSHRSLFLKSLPSQRAEIAKAKFTIEDIVGISPRGFRPPYGQFDFSTLRALTIEGMRLVMWDVDARDFSAQSTDQIVRRVLRLTHKGSIILFHDNDLTAGKGAATISTLIDEFLELGLAFAPIPL